MEPTTMSADEMRQRTLLFASTPELWQHWPFLPLVRRKNGEQELGLLYDALGARNLAGYRCTVYLCNLFLLPQTLEELLAMKHETFDNFEELVNAGWTVD